MRHKRRNFLSGLRRVLETGERDPIQITQKLIESGCAGVECRVCGTVDELRRAHSPIGVLVIGYKTCDGVQYFEVGEIGGSWVRLFNFSTYFCSDLPIPVFEEVWKNTGKTVIRLP